MACANCSVDPCQCGQTSHFLTPSGDNNICYPQADNQTEPTIFELDEPVLVLASAEPIYSGICESTGTIDLYQLGILPRVGTTHFYVKLDPEGAVGTVLLNGVVVWAEAEPSDTEVLISVPINVGLCIDYQVILSDGVLDLYYQGDVVGLDVPQYGWMQEVTYDPQTIQADCFDFENMTGGLEWAQVSGDFSGDMLSALSLATPGMELIETIEAAADATIDFTDIGESEFNSHLLYVTAAIPSVDSEVFHIRLSQSGVFIDSANYDTRATSIGLFSSQTAFRINAGSGNDTYEELQFIISIQGLGDSDHYKFLRADGSAILSDGAPYLINSMGVFKANQSACDGIQLYFGSGNVASGRFSLYGLI
jgi:hypothetical protein